MVLLIFLGGFLFSLLRFHNLQLSNDMPRRSSTGRSASRPAARPLRNPPQPVSPAPPPAPIQGRNGSMMGGLGAAVADGLAFGTGSAIAHRAVDAVMGPRVIQHETVPSSSAAAAAPAPTANSIGGSDACGGQFKALSECLNHYGSDISKCQFYMDVLQECRRSSGTVMGA
ncbi:uncharacterized protein C6C3.02c-like [Carica papaya]|uniref:uncharacterized protein C6C3.02c-like n=1 Tax=Carica papaya TaxID=3649 RepID=UPI000B8CF6A7|nr:uncharacterized protein C6C3.02c-like [Carica papaya]